MTYDKAKGTIFGLSIGDALGRDLEMLSLKEINKIYGVGGVRDLHDQAKFTDDTWLSISIAEGLAESDINDINSIMDSISKWIVEINSKFQYTSGFSIKNGLNNLSSGIHWSESGDMEAKGNGSAMRVAPIGYIFSDNPDMLKKAAEYSSKITHSHPAAIAASAGAAYLVGMAANDMSPDRYIDELLYFNKGLSREFDDKIISIGDALSIDDEVKAMDSLGKGWQAHEAVALGLYCFLKNPKDYQKTVLRAVNFLGDSDTIGCISGAISGAYNGIEGIPKKWVEKIDKRDYLEEIAVKLAEKKNGSL